MQIGLEMNAKNTNHTRKRSLHCVHCSNSVSEFSYRNYDEHIDLRTLSSMIANNIFQHLVFLSSLCVDKDLTINIH